MGSNLSRAQKKIKNTVKYKSWFFGVLATFAISFIAINFLPKSTVLRISSFIAITAIALVPAQKIINNMLSASSRCKACGAQFAIKITDSQKEFLSAIPRTKIKNEGKVGGYGPDVGKQIIQHESWTEERYKITDTHSCVECGDAQSSTRMTTQRTGYSSTKTRR